MVKGTCLKRLDVTDDKDETLVDPSLGCKFSVSFIRKISLAMSEPPLVNKDGASFELFLNKEDAVNDWIMQ
jgi:hypothetical protein